MSLPFPVPSGVFDSEPNPNSFSAAFQSQPQRMPRPLQHPLMPTPAPIAPPTATASASATGAPSSPSALPAPAAHILAAFRGTARKSCSAGSALQRIEAAPSAPQSAVTAAFGSGAVVAPAPARPTEWRPPPDAVAPSVVSGSSSLLHVSSKRIQDVVASMPALEAETQKSSSPSTSSQQSPQPEPAQPADKPQSPQPEETAAAVALSSMTASGPTPASSPPPAALPAPSPLPASLSPAPFEPPPPVSVSSLSTSLGQSPLPPPVCPAQVQSLHSLPQHSTAEPSASPDLTSSPTAHCLPHSPTANGLHGPPTSCSAAEAAATASIALQPLTLTRKPKRSLTEFHPAATPGEQPTDALITPAASTQIAQPRPSPIEPQPAPAATSTARPPAAAQSAEEPASHSRAATEERAAHAPEPASSVPDAATAAEMWMLQRIGRSLAAFDGLTTSTAEARPSARDAPFSTIAAKVSAESASQDDIEEVGDDDLGASTAAQNRVATRQPSGGKLNKRRINAGHEQRAMPRPNAHLPLTPPTPAPPLTSPASVCADNGVSPLPAPSAASQPPLLTPKPKRSVNQPLSQLQLHLNRVDGINGPSSTASAHTLPSSPLLLPPPPPTRLPVSEGGSAKRRLLEHGSFYAVEHADDDVARQQADQDESSERRRQQCATVRCEEQTIELRRLRAVNAQLAGDNQQLRSKASRLTEELRQLNQQLEKQQDSGGRGERMIQMSPLELEAYIDRRIDSRVRSLPLASRTELMED